MTLQHLQWRLNRRFKCDRTLSALRSKLHRMGLSYQLEGESLKQSQWAKILFGYPKDIRHWQKVGLKVEKINRATTIIHLADLKKFANNNPFYFCDAKKDLLLFYFGKEITDKIFKSKPNCKARKFKTIDGKFFHSLRQASMMLKISVRRIKKEIEKPNGWIKEVQ